MTLNSKMLPFGKTGTGEDFGAFDRGRIMSRFEKFCIVRNIRKYRSYAQNADPGGLSPTPKKQTAATGSSSLGKL